MNDDEKPDGIQGYASSGSGLGGLPGLEDDDPITETEPEPDSTGVDYGPIDSAVEDWKAANEAKTARGVESTKGVDARRYRFGIMRTIAMAFGAAVLGGVLFFSCEDNSLDDPDRVSTSFDFAPLDDDRKSSVGSETAVDSIEESPPVRADSAVDQPTLMVQPVTYVVLLDSDGEAWLNVRFREGWDLISVREFFSFFASFSITLNPTVEVGWERHAGAETTLGTTSEAYILEDESVVFATGLFPTAPYQLEVAARFGSWRDEAGAPAAFGEDSITINSDSIGTGDPLTDLGGPPIFDLVSGS